MSYADNAQEKRQAKRPPQPPAQVLLGILNVKNVAIFKFEVATFLLFWQNGHHR